MPDIPPQGNVTTIVQYVQAQPKDLIATIFSQPWVYLIIVVAIIGIVLVKLKGKPKRPEEEPFHGVTVRKEQTEKQVKNRVTTFGYDTKLTLYKGFVKVGKTIFIEPVRREATIRIREKGSKRSIVKDVMQEHYLIAFRKMGLWAWIKAALLHKYELMNVSPEAFKINQEDKTLRINPNAFLLDDSGVWNLATASNLDFIETLNLKKDLENNAGFTSDYLRRQAAQDPGHSKATGEISHIYAEKEKEKKARISSWAGGG